jgi:hypothetical protein
MVTVVPTAPDEGSRKTEEAMGVPVTIGVPLNSDTGMEPQTARVGVAPLIVWLAALTQSVPFQNCRTLVRLVTLARQRLATPPGM